jgi:cleavage stimulation factor subunit 2
MFAIPASGAPAQQQKHDIFVGNLDFNTTEEQLHQIFSEVGRLVRVRMVTDQDTGKPRGFAFVEFEDPQAALSAIRNMNDFELNGRRIRVNFSNSSHLEALAGKLGMDLPNTQTQQTNSAAPQAVGTLAVAEALKAMTKGELYDVVEKLKEIADRDPEDARRILNSHPQLPEAILFAMSQLEMGSPAATMLPTPIAPTFPQPVVVTAPVDPRQRADPRQQQQQQLQQQQQQQQQQPQPSQVAQPPPLPQPPRADPRARVDPRRAAAAPPPPTATPIAYTVPPNLDPALVQQVMSLTAEQIASLPPDQSQSIMALRNQITMGR